MKIDPITSNTLLGLINMARTGKLVLPQFQRNFVWSRDDITDLLISILEGYFVGSFLLLRTDPDSVPFGMRTLEGIDIIETDLKPDYMLLDGQQRLTSLHYVFAAPEIPLQYTKYPYRFFLNLNKIAQGEIEEAILSERADNINAWNTREKQFDKLIIPFTEIENWDDWIKNYEAKTYAPGTKAWDQYWDHHRDPWATTIKQIRDFTVPSLEISKIAPDNPIEIGQVCAIFEKMNSTGVRLSVYDLLTARMYRYGIDMHKLWEASVAKYPNLNMISEGKSESYGVYLLRVIALLRGMDVKSKSIINMIPDSFEEDWEIAAKYMEQALQRMMSTNSDGFGVVNTKWIPYSTMISPMAALLAQIGQNRYDHSAYKQLRKWYWSSALMERYAGAVESTIYRDYQDLLAIFKGKSDTAVVFNEVDTRIINSSTFTILEENRVNAVYRAVMCLVALKGAKDFRADDSIEFHALDDHHIFPKAYLAKQKTSNGAKIPPQLVNSIVNRTLISSDTNRRISKQSPATYLEKLVPCERLSDIMNSHFISSDAVNAMRDNDFETFLLEREKSLIDEIRRQLNTI